MAVGAGSIKRASKANAEGTVNKKAVTEEVQTVVQEEKAAVPVEQAEAAAVTAEQAKPTRKTTTRKPAVKKETTTKTTTKKAPAKKNTQPKSAETKPAEASKTSAKAAPATEPIKQKKGNEAFKIGSIPATVEFRTVVVAYLHAVLPART